MEAANQALSSESVGQVDIELKKDSDDVDDSDSDDSSNASGNKVQQLDEKNPLISETKESGENDDEEGTASEPMIQIQFALTDPNNPMMELLANNNDKKKVEENDVEDDEDGQEGPSKVRAVKSMLTSTSSTEKEGSPKIRLLRNDSTTPKKTLITELS